MKIYIKIGIVLIFTLVSSISFASGKSISAEIINVYPDKSVMELTGNVVLAIENGEKIMMKAEKAFRDGNGNIFEGNVEIKGNDFVIHTKKATVFNIDSSVMIKMDLAELTKI